ncbi:hypothetical protein [Kitasatospora sp. NPDC056181]|uniref:hypothetical protein n=1 Tax=Kitasatospora sp. NPDC056181 TaxID=3345737 RepID=UPI0035E100D8
MMGSKVGGVADPQDGFRKASLGISVALLVQSGVGMAVLLHKHVAHRNTGLFAALGQALGSWPVVLAIHAWIGLVVVGGSIHTLMTARVTGRPLFMLTSGIGMLSLLGAALSGAAYVENGSGAASAMMAVLGGVALCCYLANVAVSNVAVSIQEGRTRG